MPTETATEAPPPPDQLRRRAALLATAVALPLTVVLLLILLAVRPDDEPAAPAPGPAAAPLGAVTVPPPPPLGAAAQRSCQRLVAALPAELGDQRARPVDSPSPYVAAWGDPAVTLRCGVARPPTFVATADVQEISGVTWFPERRGDRTAWVVVDRPVYVEVVVPADAASAPVARLTGSVAASLPERQLDPVR